MSLRAKLLTALVALLAAVCVIVGVVTVVALNRFLMDRVDGQLVTAVNRSTVAFETLEAMRPPPEQTGVATAGPGFLIAPGQAEGTLGAIVIDGNVDAGVLDVSGQPQSLPPEALAALLDVDTDSVPKTVDLGEQLGLYRVVAATAPDGATLITGLTLEGVQATTVRLGVIVALVAVAGLAVAAAAGAAIVRRTLRPLERVAATASRVTELPLDRGEVTLPERVADTDADPRTEVGKVGAALNRLLGHVDSALQVRHASETRVRQFVADASHELRTPLAAIRGMPSWRTAAPIARTRSCGSRRRPPA